jgi:hypothetical protein
MPRLERDADLAVVLHAADTGTMPGARIEDDERALSRGGFHAWRRLNADERVIDRARELAAVKHQLNPKVQHVWSFTCVMLNVIVAALPEYIEEQNPALPSID